MAPRCSHMRIALGTADLQAVAFNVPVAQFYTARTLERFHAVAGLVPICWDLRLPRTKLRRACLSLVTKR